MGNFTVQLGGEEPNLRLDTDRVPISPSSPVAGVFTVLLFTGVGGFDSGGSKICNCTLSVGVVVAVLIFASVAMAAPFLLLFVLSRLFSTSRSSTAGTDAASFLALLILGVVFSRLMVTGDSGSVPLVVESLELKCTGGLVVLLVVVAVVGVPSPKYNN